MSAVTPSSVLVLGSGVIGLTVAYTLVHDHGYDGASVLIIARDMPGDLDSQAFASPWAGANWSPIGGAKEPKMYEWERYTYNKFLSMESTGQVKVMRSRNYYENASAREDVWYRNLVQNYKELTDAELPAGLGFCTEYDTVSVNPALYLPWLQENLSQKGVKFMRQKIHCLDDVRIHMNPDAVVINATSLGSRSIIGIEDSKLYPIRGQTITVNAPDIKLCCAIADKDLGPRGAITYIIPRPSPSGSVLLGGTYQVGNWDTSIDLDTAASILEQCGKLEPSLLDAASSARVISHNVGLRPAREGGPRVERQVVNLPIKNTLRGPQQSGDEAGVMRLVHAYGFGGVGYQNSWGVAQEVASLISGPW